MTTPAIHFFPLDKSLPIGRAVSVLEVALEAGVEISHSCGGMGSCTTCRIFVESSPEPMPPRGELEQETAEARGFQANERLSCQLPPVNGMVVRIPETLESTLE